MLVIPKMTPSLPGLLDVSDPINRNHPLNQGLAGRWMAIPPWDGGSAYRDLMGRYPGTLTNMAKPSGWSSRRRPGGFGSVQVGATNEYVDMTASLANVIGGKTAATFAVWYRPSSISNYTILSYSVDFIVSTLAGANRVGVDIRDGVNSGLTGVLETGNDAIAVNTWSHILVAVTNGDQRLYVNGVLASSNTKTFVSFDVDGDNNCFFGSTTNSALGNFDDYTFWWRSLSSREAVAWYQESLLGSPETLNWISPTAWFLPPGNTSENYAVSSLAVDLDQIDIANPLNRQVGVLRGLEMLFQVFPPMDGCPIWYDIVKGHTGTLTGMSTKPNGWNGPKTRPGGYGCMTLASASSAYITNVSYNGVASSGARTVLAWVRSSNSGSGTNVIVGYGGATGSTQYTFNLGADLLRTSFGIATMSATATGVSDGSWHFIATVYPEGATTGFVLMYLDGEELITSGTDTTVNTTASTMRIGATRSNTNIYNGDLDCVMFFSRALSSQEIRWLMDETMAGSRNVLNWGPPVPLFYTTGGGEPPPVGDRMFNAGWLLATNALVGGGSYGR